MPAFLPVKGSLGLRLQVKVYLKGKEVFFVFQQTVVTCLFSLVSFVFCFIFSLAFMFLCYLNFKLAKFFFYEYKSGQNLHGNMLLSE